MQSYAVVRIIWLQSDKLNRLPEQVVELKSSPHLIGESKQHARAIQGLTSWRGVGGEISGQSAREYVRNGSRRRKVVQTKFEGSWH
jgi:hypothetical protein